MCRERDNRETDAKASRPPQTTATATLAAGRWPPPPPLSLLTFPFVSASSIHTPQQKNKQTQLWEDVRSSVPVVRPAADGTSALVGPSGTAAHPVRLELDDTPGGGRHYCVPCSRHFISALALSKHAQGKPHKRRAKALQGARPHGQRDAEAAAGVGKPDNGGRGKGLGGLAPRGLGGVSASAAAATAEELAVLTGMAL